MIRKPGLAYRLNDKQQYLLDEKVIDRVQSFLLYPAKKILTVNIFNWFWNVTVRFISEYTFYARN